MKKDKDIFELIEKENKRQKYGIELIASENYVSDQIRSATGSCLTNKYAEGYPGKRYYGGCEFVDEIENIAIERLKCLFNVEYANVQPHSGSQANYAVFLACLKPGDKILGFDLSHGGHLTHGSPVNFSGILYNAFFYGLNKDGLIDMDQFERIAIKEKPKLIICGASAYSRDWNYKKFREISDSIGALLLADISHPSGLIAKGILNDPAKYCHIITSTTHKTLRGPRGGVILLPKDFENPFGHVKKNGDRKMMSTLIKSAVFPGSQGGPLEHIIAAKAIAFGEALTDEYFNYVLQVRKNAQKLSSCLKDLNYKIISGGTDNHCILIDLRSKNINGKNAEDKLGLANITVNKNMVPFDNESPFITSGIRIGTPAITTRGLKENEMILVANYINQVIENSNDIDLIYDVGNQVKKLMKNYPIFNSKI